MSDSRSLESPEERGRKDRAKVEELKPLLKRVEAVRGLSVGEMKTALQLLDTRYNSMGYGQIGGVISSVHEFLKGKE